MIFLTIGTTEPFDRLIIAMDKIAQKLPKDCVTAQVPTSNYRVRNMKTIGFLSPKEYYSIFEKATLIISHAGMGTILSALLHQKTIIVMPRRASLAEANSDHQFATANKLAKLGYVHVANNEEELFKLISMHFENHLTVACKIGRFASQQLIDSVKNYING